MKQYSDEELQQKFLMLVRSIVKAQTELKEINKEIERRTEANDRKQLVEKQYETIKKISNTRKITLDSVRLPVPPEINYTYDSSEEIAPPTGIKTITLADIERELLEEETE